MVPNERKQEMIGLARQLTSEGLSSRQVSARLEQVGTIRRSGSGGVYVGGPHLAAAPIAELGNPFHERGPAKGCNICRAPAVIKT
jgi:hypothetical protein